MLDHEIYLKVNKRNTVVTSKVIIEKSRGGRFLWNRNRDLGWIWAKWPTFLPSKLQNLLTYETTVYLKNVSDICGTF